MNVNFFSMVFKLYLDYLKGFSFLSTRLPLKQMVKEPNIIDHQRGNYANKESSGYTSFYRNGRHGCC